MLNFVHHISLIFLVYGIKAEMFRDLSDWQMRSDEIFPVLDLGWLARPVTGLIDGFARDLFRHYREPIDVDPVNIEIVYGNILTFRGKMNDTILSGLTSTNLTILDINTADVQAKMVVPHFLLDGQVKGVTGHFFHIWPYSGEVGFKLDINGVKAFIKGGDMSVVITDIIVHLNPTFSPGSLGGFAFLGLLIVIVSINCMITIFQQGKRCRRYMNTNRQSRVVNSPLINNLQF